MTDVKEPPPSAVVAAGDMVEAAGHTVGSGVIKDNNDQRLTNEDQAPLGNQTWSTNNNIA
ncbi:MAG: nucleobase:cation symporter, family, partial [Mycobacterium sp.]|nr:nucleobase:cation symporter, family [Mycobacterium sp.]